MIRSKVMATILLTLVAGEASYGASETTIRSRVFAGGLGVSDEKVFNDSSEARQVWSGSIAFSSPVPTIAASGSAALAASADFGVLKVGGSSSCNGGCGAGVAAAVTFADEMKIDRPDLSGQLGYLTTSVEYFWTGSVQNTEVFSEDIRFASYAEADVNFLLSGLGLIGAGQLTRAGDTSQSPRLQISEAGLLKDVPFSWRAEVTTPFIFGSTLPFSVSLSVSTYASGTYGPDGASTLGAQAALAADKSAYWGGMVIRLEDGSVVDDYNLTSVSETNWRMSFVPSPVPEPSNLFLMASGLGLIVLTVRLRQR